MRCVNVQINRSYAEQLALSDAAKLADILHQNNTVLCKIDVVDERRIYGITETQLKWLDRVLSFEDKSFQARTSGDGRIHLLTIANTFPAGLAGAVRSAGGHVA